MDIDLIAQLEQNIDNLRYRVEQLEKAAVTQPGIEYETDPSRPQGVVAPSPRRP